MASTLEINHIKDTLAKWKVSTKKYTLDENEIDIKIGENIWFEAKHKLEDVYRMFAQLIFTVQRVYKIVDLPIYFACFNQNQGSIIENYQVLQVLKHTDINWTQTPSQVDKKTIDRIKYLLGDVPILNLSELGQEVHQILQEKKRTQRQITKNNFLSIYQEWLQEIGNFIQIDAKNSLIGIEDCYLADLMTDGKKSIADKLKVVLKVDTTSEPVKYYYENTIREVINLFQKIDISEQEKYRQFWQKYERPPKEEYQEFILSRRDLLQAEEIREIKGAFFTPKVWSDKSKEYIEKALGENWQEEYYIWDPCCGTGNLEQGLLNQDRLYMSTLDQADLNIIREIKLMPDATQFQFDFLNDVFLPKNKGGKLPDSLWKIIQSTPEKLVIYMNPPYAEVDNKKELKGEKTKKAGKIKSNKISQEMGLKDLKMESRELFTQFYYRIYKEIKGCTIASFSTLKNCTGANFEKFRNYFQAENKRGFVCPAATFDNVKGQFPISFQIWNTNSHQPFPEEIIFDVFNQEGILTKEKKLLVIKQKGLINHKWLLDNKNTKFKDILFYISKIGNDFQQSSFISLYKSPPTRYFIITKHNLEKAMIYVAVRLCIDATWLNDRDQFCRPYVEKSEESSLELSDEQPAVKYLYEDDKEFINNCIVFALFKKNVTDWQLFRNSEIGLEGAERDTTLTQLLLDKRDFSQEAKAVLSLAKATYKAYYNEFTNTTASWKEINTSLRESKNITYKDLRAEMLQAMKKLANKIALKTHTYGFLRY